MTVACALAAAAVVVRRAEACVAPSFILTFLLGTLSLVSFSGYGGMCGSMV